MHQKPHEVFDRDAEWGDVVRFASSSHPGATLGLVYGRRRQGKSLLLGALADELGGFYFEAGQASSDQNLERFVREWAAWAGLDAPPRYTSWAEALAGVLSAVADRPVPVVIDEFNYLVATDPTLPSTLQRLYGPRSAVRARSRARLILCGSAFTVMASLLSGTAPLRGRATLELVVTPFDYLTAARFWGLERQPEAALAVYALVGGTPAYQVWCEGDAPRSARDVPRWAADHLLNPASTLHREGRVVVDEDPTVRDRLIAWSILDAVAHGATTRGAIATTVGRAATALSRPLELLSAVGLLARDDDVLRQRRSRYVLAEPVVRAHQLIVAPNERRLARRQAADVWDGAEHLIASQIYGPTFEQVARDWFETAAPATLRREANVVGWAQVPCRSCPLGQRSHQIDLCALQRSPSGQNEVIAIGEARWRNRPFNDDDLRRLEHLRARVAITQPSAATAGMVAFSKAGFTASVERRARRGSDVHLVDAAMLYG